jgi:hypothetical protein
MAWAKTAGSAEALEAAGVDNDSWAHEARQGSMSGSLGPEIEAINEC